MSLRTLKRRLKELGLQKKTLLEENTKENIRHIISTEIKGPGSLKGYRGMWNKLKTIYDIAVPRDTVMQLLKEADPAASSARKARKLCRREYLSPGPNATWHIDG